MSRKPIPKSVRFEVFKRDKFTCQYCGQSAPNVVLEIDHIKPVSKGGTNDIMNLVTSCKDCNRGKTNKSLKDDSTVRIQKQQLDAMQERREQLEMMLKWRDEMVSEIQLEVDAVNKTIIDATLKRHCLNDEGKAIIKKLIRKYGFTEVIVATEIAFDRYYNGTIESCCYAVDKIGGVCYNRKRAREDAE